MVSSDLLKQYKFKEEQAEIIDNGTFGEVGFPQPLVRHHLAYEQEDLNIEEPYYWLLDNMKTFFPIVEKIEDVFSASENSAFFGVTQQRLGIQQDKVSQYLAQVGKMVKELFQMVRELRILDERLTYYRESKSQLKKETPKRSKAAEITLKGIFVDLVQGGGKSPASVYGMSRELEFVTLPDLFFDAPPFKETSEMERYVNDLRKNFNENVTRVLTRHLRQYMEWKKRTHKEHENRRVFMVRYLRQHYDIIQMYITWMKPYLRNVRKLSSRQQHQESPDLVSAFEGSMIDVELMGRFPGKTHCLLMTFNYRTRPHMKFVQDGYQRGPVHVGLYEINWRVYDWGYKEMDNYRKMKEEENLILMGDLSGSVLESIKALGKELEKYLKESDGLEKSDKPKEDKKEKPKKSILERALGDFIDFKKKDASKEEDKDPVYKKNIPMAVMGPTWLLYKNFKKSHRMITW